MNSLNLFPIDISRNGHHIDHVFYITLVETGIAFFLVLVILIYFIIRYRARPERPAFYTHGNHWRHLLLTLALALAVYLFIDLNIEHLSAKAWDALRTNKPPLENSVQVRILAQQFLWNIQYPGPDNKFGTSDDIETMNQFRVPIHKNVLVELHSKDVIHSFCLPNFRVKQDVVPGMTTEVWFEATKLGQYEIACAELCGLGHYRMRGILTVLEQVEFEKWMADQTKEKNRPPVENEDGW